MIKLHIGCGKRNFGEHWVHIDGGDFAHVKYHDTTYFLDNSVDLIYSSHLLAYFDRSEVLDLLAEWRRVLKPNGILRLATPDFEAIAKLYLEEHYSLASFLGPLYGRMGMNEKQIYHKTCYDFKSLLSILMISKFRDVKRYDWRKTEHAMHDDHSKAYLPHLDFENGTLISLNIEAIK